MSDIDSTRPVDPSASLPKETDRRQQSAVGQDGGGGLEGRARGDQRESQKAADPTYKGHDPAVSIAASTAQIKNGEVLSAPIARLDGSERPIIETKGAVFALRPDVGLKVGDTVSLKIVETDHRLTALLTERNGAPEKQPPRVNLVVTDLKPGPKPEGKTTEGSDRARAQQAATASQPQTAPSERTEQLEPSEQKPAPAGLQAAPPPAPASTIDKALPDAPTADPEPILPRGPADQPSPQQTKGSEPPVGEVRTPEIQRQTPAGQRPDSDPTRRQTSSDTSTAKVASYLAKTNTQTKAQDIQQTAQQTSQRTAQQQPPPSTESKTTTTTAPPSVTRGAAEQDGRTTEPNPVRGDETRAASIGSVTPQPSRQESTDLTSAEVRQAPQTGADTAADTQPASQLTANSEDTGRRASPTEQPRSPTPQDAPSKRAPSPRESTQDTARLSPASVTSVPPSAERLDAVSETARRAAETARIVLSAQQNRVSVPPKAKAIAERPDQPASPQQPAPTDAQAPQSAERWAKPERPTEAEPRPEQQPQEQSQPSLSEQTVRQEVSNSAAPPIGTAERQPLPDPSKTPTDRSASQGPSPDPEQRRATEGSTTRAVSSESFERSTERLAVHQPSSTDSVREAPAPTNAAAQSEQARQTVEQTPAVPPAEASRIIQSPKIQLSSAPEQKLSQAAQRQTVPRFEATVEKDASTRLARSPIAFEAPAPEARALPPVSGITAPLPTPGAETPPPISLPLSAFIQPPPQTAAPDTTGAEAEAPVTPRAQAPVSSAVTQQPPLSVPSLDLAQLKPLGAVETLAVDPEGRPILVQFLPAPALAHVAPLLATEALLPITALVPVATTAPLTGPQGQTPAKSLGDGPTLQASTPQGTFLIALPAGTEWQGARLLIVPPTDAPNTLAGQAKPDQQTPQPATAGSNTAPDAQTAPPLGSVTAQSPAQANPTPDAQSTATALPNRLGAQSETRAALLRAQARIGTANKPPTLAFDTVPYRAQLTVNAHTSQQVEVRFSRPGAPTASSGEHIRSVSTLSTHQSPTGLRADVKVSLDRGDLRLTLPLERIPFAGGQAHFVSTPTIEAGLSAQNAPPSLAQALAVGLSSLPPVFPERPSEGWPAFEAAASILASPQQTNPMEARTAMGGPKLINSVLFMLSVLGRGAPAEWIGSVEHPLKDRQPGLLDRLRSDIEKLGHKVERGTASAGEWRALHIPFDYRDNDLSFLHMIWRRSDGSGQGDKDQQTDPDQKDRDGAQDFALGLDLTRLGPVHLEGTIGAKTLSVTLSSASTLSKPLKSDLISLFQAALEANGYGGKLAIDDKNQHTTDKLQALRMLDPGAATGQ